MNYEEPLTEGETIIAEFLKEKNIKYISQYKIKNLKQDNNSYRIADFYLPRYKLCIEFLGKWNSSEDERKRYKDKMRVYYENEIPCVYIFPDNLGPLEQIFNIRILKELKSYKMRKELLKYQFYLLLRDRKGLFFWLIISAVCLIFGDYTSEPQLNPLYISIFLGIFVYQLIRLFGGILKYFK